MKVSSLHVEKLMKIEETLKNDEFFEAMLSCDQILFEDGYYKNGPTIIEMDPSLFNQQKQTFQFYIPVNQNVEVENGQWIDVLDCPYVLRERVPFDDGIGEVLENMIDFLNDQDIIYGPHLFLVMTNVYDDYWADILIPIEQEG